MTATPNPWRQYTRSWSRPAIKAFMRLDGIDSPKDGAKYDGKFMDVDLFKMADSYVTKFRDGTAVNRQGVVRILNSAKELRKYSLPLNEAAQEMVASIVRGLLEGADAFINSRTPDFKRYTKPELGFLPEQMNFLADIIIKKELPLHKDYWAYFWRTNIEGCQAPIFDKPMDCPF